MWCLKAKCCKGTRLRHILGKIKSGISMEIQILLLKQTLQKINKIMSSVLSKRCSFIEPRKKSSNLNPENLEQRVLLRQVDTRR